MIARASARLDAALSAAEDMALSLGAKGLRDRREPGRREKQRFEARYQAIVQRHFRRQARRVRGWLEANPPVRLAGKAALPMSLDEALEYDDDFSAELLRLYREVAYHGVALFGADVSFDIDYTLVNREAAQWARQHVGTLIKGIDETTRGIVRESVASFVETPGMTIGALIQSLPFDAGRAERVAVTEITRAYGETARIAGEELRREFPDVAVVVMWFTNNDDRVCPICGPLNKMEVWQGEPFVPADEGREAVYAPPAHVNCRCWARPRTDILRGTSRG